MTTRALLLGGLGLAGAVLFSIAVLDHPLALWLSRQPLLVATGVAITAGLEWLFAFRLSIYFYLSLLLAAGLGLHAYDRGLQRAGILYVLGASLYLTRITVSALKQVFERVRPGDHAAAAPDAPEFFVSGAHSFPSGHAAWYFGLLLPLALLFPRYRWPLLGLACAGALARVLEGDHYLADVLASALVALMVSAALIALLRRAQAATMEKSR